MRTGINAVQMFPLEHAARVTESADDEVDMTTLRVPLFVCDGVPFPGEPLQLLLFEHK